MISILKRIPPNKILTPALNSWLSQQRRRKREGKLNGEQVNALEKLNIGWDSKKYILPSWRLHYRNIMRFKELNGHTRVVHFNEDTKLGNWV